MLEYHCLNLKFLTASIPIHYFLKALQTYAFIKENLAEVSLMKKKKKILARSVKVTYHRTPTISDTKFTLVINFDTSKQQSNTFSHGLTISFP